MRNKYTSVLIVLSICFLLSLGHAVSAQTEDAPPNIAAVLTAKLIGFATNISSDGQEISIYVLRAPEVATELEKAIGQPVGKAILKTIESGDFLPENHPSVLFVGEYSDLDSVKAYTHANHVLSITHKPDLVNQGITLGMGLGTDNKPKILLNLNTTQAEKIDWNPAIMKVAVTIK